MKLHHLFHKTTLPGGLLVGILLCASAVQAQQTALEKGGGQPTFSKVFTPNTIGPGSTSMLTFTITNGSGVPVTDLAFTDTLPAGVTLADPAGGVSTCGGTLTAPDGGGTITFTDGAVAGGANCTIMVNVTSSTPGVHMNVSGDLTSSAGNSGTAQADLTVVTTRPGFSKSFAPSSIPRGDRSTLTFTIDNTLNASRVSSLDFTDNLPDGMVVADPPNASTDCVSAGIPDTTITAVPGGSTITLDADGAAIAGFEVLPIGATCTVTVDVVGTGNGMLHNVSEELGSVSGIFFELSGKAVATLEVTVTPLSLTKSFTDDPLPPGGDVTLEFTISNRDRDFSATGIAFTDDLTTLVPALAGLTFNSLLSNDCGGSVSGAGGTTIGFTGGTVPAQGSCTIRVSLSVPIGALTGAYTNTTGTITGTVDGSPVVGNMASDDLFVEAFPLLTKEFTDDPVSAGDTVTLEFTITNTDPTSAATAIAFQDEFPVILPTAAMVPGNDLCGAGSTSTFTPLSNFPGNPTIPATLSVSGASLAPAGMAGDSCTFSIVLNVNLGAAAGIYPNETSEITAMVGGQTVTGPPATDDLIVVTAPKLTKEFTDDPVPPGGTVTLEFTLALPEEAPSGATAITFTDDLAATLTGLTATGLPINGICNGGSLTGTAGDTLLNFSGGSLTPGESCTFSVALDVPAGAASGTHTNGTSAVVATVQGVSAMTSGATDDLLVTGLLFSKEFIDDPVLPGGTATLRFTLDNTNAAEDATTISFTDPLPEIIPGPPPDVTVVETLPINVCGGILIDNSGSVVLAGGSVLAGETCSFDITLLVPASATPNDYGNTTGVLTASIDGNIAILPAANDTLSITAGPLSISKEFTDDPVEPGNAVTLEFALMNASATDAVADIAFTDDLDAALSGLVATGLPSAECGGTVSTPDGGMTIDFSGGSLAAGASCTFSVTLTVPAGATTGINSNVTSNATGTVGGLAVTANPASDELAVRLLQLTKAFENAAEAGGAVDLTFTIRNVSSTDSATDLAFTDDLDAALSGLTATSLPSTPCGAGSAITGTSLLTMTGGNLLPGGSCTFSVTLQVPASPLAGLFPNTTSDLRSGGQPVAPPGIDTLVVTTFVTNEVTVNADGANEAMGSTTDAITIAPPP